MTSPVGLRASTLASLVVVTALTLSQAGCNGSSGHGAATCDTSTAPGTVSTVATGVGPSEGIAFLDGELYVSGGSGLRHVGTDGVTTPIANVPSSIGMVAWNGALYIASQSDGSPSGFCAPTNHGVIWRVTSSGEATIFARGFISPNFLVVTPWNTLLVSDDCYTNKTIFEVDAEGNKSDWSDDVLSANGMGFDPAYGNLFVVNTFVRTPALYRIPIEADDAPGTATSVASFASGSTPDGLAVDSNGNVYVALNVLGQVAKITPDGTQTIFASGLTTPASFAFGDGPDYDACSMYVTSLTGDDISRIAVGVTGVPLAGN